MSGTSKCPIMTVPSHHHFYMFVSLSSILKTKQNPLTSQPSLPLLYSTLQHSHISCKSWPCSLVSHSTFLSPLQPLCPHCHTDAVPSKWPTPLHNSQINLSRLHTAAFKSEHSYSGPSPASQGPSSSLLSWAGSLAGLPPLLSVLLCASLTTPQLPSLP